MQICPRCKKEYSGYPALSRQDNETEICPTCGMNEAIEELERLKSDYAEKDEYLLDLEEENENLTEYNTQLIERIKELEQ